MKIVCDSCSTKYSISDDKVRGKVFKIRCKKCSHIIVVKGTTEEGNAVSEAPAEPSWHVVIDGEQVGPLGDADVRARLARSEIAPDSYVWKEGFADWQRLADVPDFADVAPAAVAGELYSEGSSAVASLGQASSLEAAILPGNLFGARGAVGAEGHVGAPVAFSGAATRAPEHAEAFGPGVGGAPSGLGSENGDLFGMATPFVAPDSGRVRTREKSNGSLSGRNDVLRNEARNDTRHDGGRIENLTAQRSENSVLFSLSNLQSLASPGAAIRPPSTTTTTDGSGLIDIRAMAASTLGASGNGFGPSAGGGGPSSDDLPAFTAFSSAAPVLLPLPSNSGPPKWVYLVIGSVLLMVFAIVIAAVSILRKPVTVEQAAAPAPVQQPVAAAAPPAAGTGAAPAVPPTSKTLAPSDLPPREGAESAGPGVDKGAAEHVAGPRLKHTGKLHKGGLGAGQGGGATSGAGAMVAAAPAEPDKPKAAKGSLDDLLEGALKPRNRPRVDDDNGARRSGASGADAPSAGPLSKAAVVAGMNGVKGKVGDCYNQFKVPGMAMVNVNIGKSGKVTSSAVTGKFQGTPTGACVEKAVRTASFPPSDGLSTPYPFNLR